MFRPSVENLTSGVEKSTSEAEATTSEEEKSTSGSRLFKLPWGPGRTDQTGKSHPAQRARNADVKERCLPGPPCNINRVPCPPPPTALRKGYRLRCAPGALLGGGPRGR
eukprot:14183841-Alexandrium_andersonii.AAC.1